MLMIMKNKYIKQVYINERKFRAEKSILKQFLAYQQKHFKALLKVKLRLKIGKI